MSIINEALKKAGQKRKDFPEPEPLVSEPQPEPKVERKKRLNKRLIILGISSLMGCVLLFSFFVVKKPSIGEKIEKQSTPEVSFKEEVIFPAPKPKEGFRGQTPRIDNMEEGSDPASSLSLTGIIQGYGGPAAIINERIVEEGDFIGGARVIEIGQGEVRLNFEGEDLLLTLK